MEIKSPAAEYLKNVTKNKSSELVSGDLDEALNNEYTNIRELAKSKKLIIQPIKALCVGFNSQQRDLSCARTAKLCSLLIHADLYRIESCENAERIIYQELLCFNLTWLMLPRETLELVCQAFEKVMAAYSK